MECIKSINCFKMMMKKKIKIKNKILKTSTNFQVVVLKNNVIIDMTLLSSSSKNKNKCKILIVTLS